MESLQSCWCYCYCCCLAQRLCTNAAAVVAILTQLPTLKPKHDWSVT